MLIQEHVLLAKITATVILLEFTDLSPGYDVVIAVLYIT